MRTLQIAALTLFLAFAALTAFFQLRVGMTSGNASRKEVASEDDPAVAKSRRRAVCCAVCAAVCLAVCIVLGAIGRLL